MRYKVYLATQISAILRINSFDTGMLPLIASFLSSTGSGLAPSLFRSLPLIELLEVFFEEYSVANVVLLGKIVQDSYAQL